MSPSNLQMDPMPSLGRMMVFIDGENMVFRFQEMLAQGRELDDRVIHCKDTYVWQPYCIRPGLNWIVRATYYTYVTGDDKRQSDVAQEIKDLTFDQYSVAGQASPGKLLRNLNPCVFKKRNRSKKAKGVDIQLTVDILTNVYNNNLDSVFLISGDGDYKPVIQEAMRYGKQVVIAAFSSGLNSDLKHLADSFICIDSYFFKDLVTSDSITKIDDL